MQSCVNDIFNGTERIVPGPGRQLNYSNICGNLFVSGFFSGNETTGMHQASDQSVNQVLPCLWSIAISMFYTSNHASVAILFTIYSHLFLFITRYG